MRAPPHPEPGERNPQQRGDPAIHSQKHSGSFGLKLTKAGALYILITLVLGFGAVNTGNNLIYLLVSALLGFMAVSGILGKRNLDRLEVLLHFSEELYDGLPTLVGVELQNGRKFLPAYLIEVLLEAEEGSVLFPLVSARGADSGQIPMTFRGRGSRSQPSVTVRSIFPINFFIRYKALKNPGRMTVFPAPRKCPPPFSSGGKTVQGEQERASRGVDGDVDRIHDYRGGEPLKLIHWKLSARHDNFKVKDLASTSRDPLWIDPASCPGETLEERLRCAVYLVNRCGKEERPVGLRLPDQRIAPAAGRRPRLHLLHLLATYGEN